MIDASRSIDDLHEEIKTITKQTLAEAKQKELGQLWVENTDTPPAKRPDKTPQINGVTSAISGQGDTGLNQS